ncbi:MAG: hypothetical protein K9M98_10765 [Cephaloticoccus sp.]|nr:hypothetical protein [Cephaloticoccus sp.]
MITKAKRTKTKTAKIRRGSVTTSVYQFDRKDGRTIYTAAWTIGRRRYTRQFQTYAAAHAEASLKADQLAAGRINAAGSVTVEDGGLLTEARKLIGDVPLLSALHEWVRARKLTKGQVIAAAEAWAARNSNTRKSIKVEVVLKRFLDYKTKAGYAVAKDHKSAWNSIRETFGDQDIGAITTQQIESWITAAALGSHVTRRKRIVSLWNWAQDQHYLSRDIKNEAIHTQKLKSGDMDVGVINAATYAKLLTYFRTLHPEYLPSLVLAGFAGLRSSEVHKQTWDDINLEAGHLRVSKAKKGTPARRLVPLCPAAIEWLLLAPDRTEWICGNLAVERIRKIATRAKFVLPENCFRHSYITHLVAKSGNIAETSLVAGNSPAIIRKHYLELVTKSEGEAWFNIRPSNVGEVIDLANATGS